MKIVLSVLAFITAFTLTVGMSDTKNPPPHPNLPHSFQEIRDHFTVLRSWRIDYHPEMDLCKSVRYNKMKYGIIYGCSTANDDHLLHEFIHLGIGASQLSKTDEEIFVRDLLKLVY
jgi:hypothetical protein